MPSHARSCFVMLGAIVRGLWPLVKSAYSITECVAQVQWFIQAILLTTVDTAGNLALPPLL